MRASLPRVLAVPFIVTVEANTAPTSSPAAHGCDKATHNALLLQLVPESYRFRE